jgi:type I restriction enzyme S subunit
VKGSAVQTVPIKELYQGLYDGPHATPKPSEDGPVFLGIKNVTEDGKLDLSEIRHIAEDDFPAWTRRVEPQPGDLVFTYEATLNRYAIVPEGFRGCLGRRMALIRPDSSKVDTRFLFYYFFTREWRTVISSNMLAGATVDRVPLTKFPDFPVRVPPLPVQRRIAGILSAYDELIENNQRRIKILEEMARSLYREWFVHFRFPGHDKVKMVPSPLGPIPYGWEASSIDDICELVTDGSHSSPRSVEEGLPMASSKDMHEWGLNLDTCRHISRQDYDQLVRNGCKPKKNDVLITKDGANYLKHIFIVREELELVLLSSIAILRPNERINPYLLTAILSDPKNKDRLKNYVTGAAIPRIILSDFKQFKIVLPSQEVQDAWASIGEPITQLCWRLIDQIANLRRTRDLLLPRLLSGQIPLSC